MRIKKESCLGLRVWEEGKTGIDSILGRKEVLNKKRNSKSLQRRQCECSKSSIKSTFLKRSREPSSLNSRIIWPIRKNLNSQNPSQSPLPRKHSHNHLISASSRMPPLYPKTNHEQMHLNISKNLSKRS